MYHAGCLADVHKHSVLSLVLDKMVQKDKPLTYMETHAGRGLYDLSSVEAQKTGEAEVGIIRLLREGRLEAAHPYMRAIASVRQMHGAHAYPGSPLIANALLRPVDPIALMELHPQEYEALRSVMGKRAQVVKADGLQKLLEMSPPKIKRGLVLVDPSYEVKTDYSTMVDFVLRLHKQWPVAVIMLWYPVLASGAHLPMVERLSAAGFPKCWQQEVRFPARYTKMANGSGVLAVNMPYGIEEETEKVKALIQM